MNALSPEIIIENNVNLRSYSTSEGFLGFFERRGSFSNEIARNAINLLLGNSLFDSALLSIVSNLFVFGDDGRLMHDYDLRQRQLRELIFPLISEGLLTRIESSQDCSTRMDGEDLSSIMGISDHLIKSLFFAVMTVGGVRGHCFGYAPECKLIVYPHEESGFGFICTSPKTYDRKRLQEYILQSFSNSNFQVTIF